MVKDTSIDFKSFPIGIVVKYFALLHFPEKNYEYFLPEKNWFLLFLTVGSLSVNLSLLKTVLYIFHARATFRSCENYI